MLPAVPDAPVPPAELTRLIEQAEQFAAAALSAGTRANYRSALRAWRCWCEARGIAALPAAPAAVALYAAHLAGLGRKVGTIDLAVAAIAWAHRQQELGFDTKHPALKNTLKGIRNRLGVAPDGKRALVIADVRRIVAALPPGLAGIRDRAVILLGFASACRRAELCGLDLGERAAGTGYLETLPQGLRLFLAKSKTDQEGRGRHVAVLPGGDPATCPVQAVADWIAVAGITRGAPLFRAVDRHGYPGGRLTGPAVGDLVKRADLFRKNSSGRLGL